MSNKNKKREGIVYSTDPGFTFADVFSGLNNQPETGANSQQKLRVLLERKGRGGKEVTLVLGFEGNDRDQEALGKELKSHCGTGGHVKDGEIVVQGDQRDKVLKYLLAKGYSQAKRGN
jgi:translation initiation factor 1